MRFTALAAAIGAIAAIADEIDHHPTVHLEHPHLRVTIVDANTVVEITIKPGALEFLLPGK